ncbi:hypothetical protein DXT68_14280 [Microbacterium foliorum]|uniref:SGNH hydrolase-type esterase domain-containing protein n=1 Tax=Microbacterium foliorum TaxID=104336 RepID=A0A0F0KL20_9MICO|nr:SGNH/GDSL hydrolase family protein [Microbacterium foliorum]AXL13171.1 hypothetical protein DXT68_14280 [Microbacterium foliorum]KJL21134.1 hypothetical protein RN50_01818 [Microbacterium foliorum]
MNHDGWFDLPLTTIAGALRGSAHVKTGEGGVTPSHFTSWATDRVMSPVFTVVASAAGGARIELATDARRIRIDYSAQRTTYGPAAPRAPFAAVSDGVVWSLGEIEPEVGSTLFIDEHDQVSRVDGPEGQVLLERPSGATSSIVDICLPLDAAIVIHGLAADAPVAARPAADRVRWLHHGSSISQGGHLRNPLHPWPVQVARRLDIALTNASLPGNSLLDPCVVEELAGIDADVVSLEIGINVANWDSHISRTFVPAVHNLLDQFRLRQPNTPLIVISPLFCPTYENRGGVIQMDESGSFHPVPNARDDALSLTDIRGLLASVIASRSDDLIFSIDGRELLGPDEEPTLTDGLHPDLLGTTLIADRFAELASGPDGALSELFGTDRDR